VTQICVKSVAVATQMKPMRLFTVRYDNISFYTFYRVAISQYTSFAMVSKITSRILTGTV
jgi:hypothetical protein